MSKRKQDYLYNSNKRLKNDTDSESELYNENIWDKMEVNNNVLVSGSAIKNYLLNDPLIDWLDLYYNDYKYGNQMNKKKNNNKKAVNNNKMNNSIILQNGITFEEAIISEMKQKYKNKYAHIAYSHADLTDEKAKETLQKMNEGVPIIFQAVLIDRKIGLWGIADILIRNDYLSKIWKNHLDEYEANKKGKLLNNKYHYRVIDIKWTTLNMCVDGRTIRNSERIPAYKGQLAIYNKILGKMQGYYPAKTYILCNAMRNDDSLETNTCFERLGEIEYNGFDDGYIERTQEGINWIRDVRKNGHSWHLIPPSNSNLYPNMSNHTDTQWTEIKNDIANEIKELTQIWMVGVKNRRIGHKNGIYKWDDIRCCANSMGIYGDRTANIVDKIININNNRNRNKNIMIMPKKIVNNALNWQTETPYDIYIDFETVNECFIKEPTCNNKMESNIIFMIGCGYIENNKWMFKQFIMNDINIGSEKQIIDEWRDFINTLIENRKKKYIKDRKKNIVPRFIHWSSAEKTASSIANIRHKLRWQSWLDDAIWIDLCRIFQDEPIVIKGAFNFKLKDIAKAMHSNGMINTTWDTNGVSNGLSAMMDAIEYYKNKNNDKMKSIGKYNEIDCRVMWEIIEYLRNNHI